MKNNGKIDRKTFLTWTLAAAGGAVLGCTESEPQNMGAAGTGGGAGTGAAGTGAAGTGAAGTGAAGTGAAGNGAAGTGAAGTGAAGTGAAGNGAAGTGAAGTGAAGSGAAGSGGGMLDCGTNLKVSILRNHGHILTIPLADITAGKVKAYETHDEPGMNSMHTHWVQLTAQDFTDLKAGKSVRKASCDDGHEHEYVINCVGATTTAETPMLPMFCGDHHDCGASGTANFCPNTPAP